MSPEESEIKLKISKLRRIRNARNGRCGELQILLMKCRAEIEELDKQIAQAQLELLRAPALSLLHARILYRAWNQATPAIFNVSNAHRLVELRYLTRVAECKHSHQAYYRITEEGRARFRKDYPDGQMPGAPRSQVPEPAL